MKRQSNMQSSPKEYNSSFLRVFSSTLLLLSALPSAHAYTQNLFFAKNPNPKPRPARRGPPEKRDGNLPLRVSNLCEDTLWPGIGTQAGTGAGTGGFELASGSSRDFMVSADWQGRVWGRTNCSFNVAGNGPANPALGGAACTTGDCGGVLDCVATGATPVSLAEFDYAGGSGGKQVFYDISLVDGYNIPIAIIFIPGDTAPTKDIPPNLTNAACIATAGWLEPPSDSGLLGNASTAAFPIPYEPKMTNDEVARWCPWDLQVTPPTKPGDGVYPYPDDNIKRPVFDPCLAACIKTHNPSDCCTGAYSDRNKCKPNLYATQAKAVCPDAYSYPFDDDTSTFIIPTGGGFEVQFCPPGRSTNILATFQQQLNALSTASVVSKAVIADCQNTTIIKLAAEKSSADRSRGDPGAISGTSLGALVVVLAWAVLW